ncbi:MAG: glycine cleavage system aminomethyltransferase GcvT [Phycisphaeraceae bacterium]|nr:glycine cleavage system aminomethyltransferase GcvT [Phycisphaeraceae bacterium]
MQRTPFYKFMAGQGAKFVDFAGWEMPISFGSIIEEHQHVRACGGLFDVSHMGRIELSGRHARRLLERTLTRYVTDMQPKTCRYALMCNERGGVLDDVIVYCFEGHWLLVVNASNRTKIVSHLQQQIAEQKMVVKMEDQTGSTAMVALQGPKVMEIIGKFSREVPTLKKYAFCTKNLLILKLTISRTGYTGEDGVEVMMGAGMAEKALSLLARDTSAQSPLRPCGLGARDTLRIEAAMPLYGHELTEDIDPLTAGLTFAVNMDKHARDRGERFIGQDALEKIAQEGPRQIRIGLRCEGKRTPRQGMPVLKDDAVVGQVTSGCLSPTLGYPIAMAYVQAGALTTGQTAAIDLGMQKLDAVVVDLPFYRHG